VGTASGVLDIAGPPPRLPVPPSTPPLPPVVPPAQPIVIASATPPVASLSFLSTHAESALSRSPVNAPDGGFLVTPNVDDAAASRVSPVFDGRGTGAIADSARLTRGDGDHFPIVVTGNAQTNGAQGLMLNRGMADQVVDATARAEILVPADAFAATDPGASIQLSAAQANGRPLPNWVSFDARTGKFTVQAPKGVTGELSIRLVARDARGHEAVTVFKVRVGGKGDLHTSSHGSGRSAFSEQIRLAAVRHSAAGSIERLTELAQAAAKGGGAPG